MIGAVLSPLAAAAVRHLLAAATVGYLSTRERDARATLADLAAAAQTHTDILLIDTDAGPPAALVQGMRHYRTARARVRVILLAPGREPGDPLVSALVALGVYDIVTPAGSGDLEPALASALGSSPATYADAARWHAPASPLQPAARREAAGPPDRWRVMGPGHRPYLVGVADIDGAGGASDLAYHLAQHLASQGVRTALLLDRQSSEVDEVRAQLVPPGLPLDIYPHDPPAQPPRRQPPPRLRTALAPPTPADVAIVDLGHVDAARHEPDLLAATDRLLMVWPYSPVLFLSSLRWVYAHRASLARTLGRSIHVAYLAPGGSTARLTRTLREVTDPADPGFDPPQVIAVQQGQYGPDLRPLLDAMAPLQHERDAQAGQILTALLTPSRRLGATLQRALLRVLPVTVRLTIILVLAWVLLTAIQAAGADLPAWVRTGPLGRFLAR